MKATEVLSLSLDAVEPLRKKYEKELLEVYTALRKAASVGSFGRKVILDFPGTSIEAVQTRMEKQQDIIRILESDGFSVDSTYLFEKNVVYISWQHLVPNSPK